MILINIVWSTSQEWPSFYVCVHKSEIMTPLYILSAAWIITASWINNQSQHILLLLLIRKSISVVQNITTKDDQSITYGLCWNVGGLGSLAVRARVDRVLYSKKSTSFSNIQDILKVFHKFYGKLYSELSGTIDVHNKILESLSYPNLR